MTKNWEEIIKGCINNNRKFQKEFYDYFAGKFMTMAKRIAPDDVIANDILQDSFIKIFKKLKHLNSYDEPAVYKWSNLIIYNTGIDYYRKENKYYSVINNPNIFEDYEEDRCLTEKEIIKDKKSKGRKLYEFSDIDILHISDDSYDDVDTYIESKNLKPIDIINAIQQLTPKYKMVFNLYSFDGFTHEEISEILNISSGTSKTNLAKARIKLKQLLTKD